MTSAAPRRPWNRLRADLFERPAGNFAVLDGLRAFGALLLVAFHSGLLLGVLSDGPGHVHSPSARFVLSGLHSGVDIFFVLSGFLIGRILLRDLASHGSPYWRAFWIRRAFRIFPAYYLVLGVSYALAVEQAARFRLLYGTTSLAVLRDSAWANVLFLNNYLSPDGPNLLGWGWSLCVEEHFYLALPPLLWLLFRAGDARLRAVALPVLALVPWAGRALQYALGSDSTGSLYHASHHRFDPLLIGVWIALLYVEHRPRLERAVARAGGWLPAAGVALWVWVWTQGGLYRPGWFVGVHQFALMGIGTGLVVAHGLFAGGPVSRFFAHPAWVPLARVSYGVYLVHPFVFIVARGMYRTSGLALGPEPRIALLFGATYAVSNLLAAAMFVALERPLLALGGRLARRYRPGG